MARPTLLHAPAARRTVPAPAADMATLQARRTALLEEVAQLDRQITAAQRAKAVRS